MKLRAFLISTSTACLLGTTALAGGLGEPVTAEETVTAKATSSSGGLVVPLLLLLLIAAAASGGGNGIPEGPSDRRIKTDIEWARMEKGFAVYRYRYIGSSQVFEGVMAQEVLSRRPDAVKTHPTGMMAVDYGKLSLSLRTIQ